MSEHYQTPTIAAVVAITLSLDGEQAEVVTMALSDAFNKARKQARTERETKLPGWRKRAALFELRAEMAEAIQKGVNRGF